VLEGYANTEYLELDRIESFARFNGKSSSIEIPSTRDTAHLTNKSHTISVLVRANQQEDKVPIWLVGDYDRRFCEYPILRRPGYDYGLSYNNSRAYTALLWNHKKEALYQWMKRYENEWSWVTLSVDTLEKTIHFYLNGKESDARHGHGTHSPQSYEGNLKRYGSVPYLIGTTTSVGEKDVNKYFKGDVAKVMVWDRKLDSGEIENLHKDIPSDGLKMYYEFENSANNIVGNDNHGKVFNVGFGKEKIKIPYPPIPHRVAGRMTCLPHKDEGLITDDKGQDRWAKGETTARNERRYVLEMQQGTWDYKSDGIKQLKYELLDIEEINPKAKLINVKL